MLLYIIASREKAELSYTYVLEKWMVYFNVEIKFNWMMCWCKIIICELKGNNFTIRSYISIENTGNSYNVKPLADNLGSVSGGVDTKTPTSWGTKFKNALNAYATANGGLNICIILPLLHNMPVSRPMPVVQSLALPDFDSLVNVIHQHQ